METFERVFQDRGLHIKKSSRSAWQKLNQDNFPWEKIFVSGYGSGIRVQGTADFQYFLAVDAVYPLFRYDVPLQNPELVIRRLVEAAMGIRKDPELKLKNAEKILNEVKHLLAKFLDLKDDDQIILSPTGIRVTGRWGVAELGELGDGYRSKVTLILDLLAWWFLKDQGKLRRNINDIKGIVLIDEVEQHLHPLWQRTILNMLQFSFPQIQFIATSHSPLVASGGESNTVHILQNGEHRTVKPFGWLAEDVYTLMGLDNSRSVVFNSEKLNEYERLYEKRLRGKATSADLYKLKVLRKDLALLPESDPVSLTTEINSITKNLRKLIKHEEGK